MIAQICKTCLIVNAPDAVKCTYCGGAEFEPVDEAPECPTCAGIGFIREQRCDDCARGAL